ncbi:MAG: NADH-quinone oxidoreductase subunit N [Dehalococcoidia bacterium]|nr:NADH-quinone oxidoreductase subunit N [Dehalococcoidia bacterium]
MTWEDLRLLSPEVAMVGVATFVILLDLVVSRKGFLALASVLGLLIPLGLSIWLWVDVSQEPGGQLAGIFNLAESRAALTVDQFALFFKFLVIGVVALIVLASTDYVGKMSRYQGEYYGLILMSATGMMLLAAAGELITIYISLELTALPLAALAAFLMTARSSEAGIKFLVLSAVSSGLLLYGMALVFGFTGSTYLSDIGEALSGAASGGTPFGSYAMLVGIVLMIAGFGFKISAVPFQMWVPDVYEGAPTPVTAYLSVASKAAGFAVLLRVFYTSFGAFEVDWGILFAALAAASMTVGNLVAVAQTNIKRLLGYSTIAHAGYLLVGLAAVASRTSGDPGDSILGPSSVLFYLGAYAATNLAAFFAIIAISNKTGSEQIGEFAGMARRAPYVAFALALALVALVGVPPTGIFISKLYIFTAAVNSDLAWLAIVGVVNSVVSAYYYLRVVRVMYLDPPASEERLPSSYPFRLALGLSVLAVLFVGIVPGPLLRLAEIAVGNLV